MTTFPLFDECYRPKIQTHLDRDVVGFMEKKVKEVQRTNDVDEAERILEAACKECVQNVEVHMAEIKASVLQKGKTCTSSEDRQKYKLFVEGAAAGIRSTQGLFNRIFERVRAIVNTVVNWIRDGLVWMSNVVTGAFTYIRSFFNN